jgi:putative thioredoxin
MLHDVGCGVEQAKQTLAMVPESKRNDAAVKAVQTAIELAEQAQIGRSDRASWNRKSPQTRSIIRRRFDLATGAQCDGQAH